MPEYQIAGKESGGLAEVEFDAVGGPGGDTTAEEVGVLGPDRTLQRECSRENRRVILVSSVQYQHQFLNVQIPRPV